MAKATSHAVDPNVAFVSSVYKVILERSATDLKSAGTQADINSYAGLITSGVFSSDDVIQLALANQLTNNPGDNVQTNVEPVVALYEGFFNRAPTLVELNAGSNALRAGGTLVSLGTTLLAASVKAKDFSALYGASPTATAFVQAVYKDILGHTASSSILSFWTTYLGTGALAADKEVNVIVNAATNAAVSSAADISRINGKIDNWLIQAVTGDSTPGGSVPTGVAGINKPGYALKAAQPTVDTGGKSDVFTLTTKNVATGTVVNYTVSGISSSRYTLDGNDAGSNSGSVTVGADGKATVTLAVLADTLGAAGNGNVTVKFGSLASASAKVNDTYVAPPPPPVPTYKVTDSGTTVAGGSNTVTEGSNVVFTLATTNVKDGTVLGYTVIGNAATTQVATANQSGSFIVFGNKATATIPTLANTFTGGTSTLALQLTNGQAIDVVTINETALQTYIVGKDASATSFTEGTTPVFKVTTTNVAAGTVLNYQLSGITAAQLASGSIVGQVTVAADGSALIPINLTATKGSNLTGNLTVTLSLPATAGTGSVAAASVALVETVNPVGTNLTTGSDSISITLPSSKLNGVYNATTGATFTVGDNISATSTGNSLNLTDGGTAGAALFDINVAGTTVNGIQTLNVTSAEGVKANVGTNNAQGWAGLTALNILDSSVTRGTAITAASTTAITLKDVGATTTGTESILGGSTVTVTITDTAGNAVGDAVTIGSTSAAAVGAISLTDSTTTITGSNLTGAIAITGGTTVTVVESMAGDKATTTTGGGVTVTGTSNTTSVSVTQTAAVTQTASVAGIVDGAVQITDASATSSTTANTITSATLANYGTGSFVKSNALSSLSLTGGTGTLAITTAGAGVGATTLALALTGSAAGTITDTNNEISTINMSATGANTVTIADTGLKTLNITGAGSLTESFASNSGLTTILDSATGTQTMTFGTSVNFNGTGSGQDIITLSGTTTGTITGSTAAGNTIIVGINGTGVSSLGTITNFTKLGFNATSSGTFDLSKLSGFTFLDIASGSTLAVKGISSTVTGASIDIGTTSLTLQTADTTASADSFALTLGTAAGSGVAVGTLLVTDSTTTNPVGTLNLASTYTATGQTNTISSLDPGSPTGTGISALNISGNAGLSIAAWADSSASLTITNTSTETVANTYVITDGNNKMTTFTIAGSETGANTLTHTNTSLSSITDSASGTVAFTESGALTSTSLAITDSSSAAATYTIASENNTTAVTIAGTGTGASTVTLPDTAITQITDNSAGALTFKDASTLAGANVTVVAGGSGAGTYTLTTDQITGLTLSGGGTGATTINLTDTKTTALTITDSDASATTVVLTDTAYPTLTISDTAAAALTVGNATATAATLTAASLTNSGTGLLTETGLVNNTADVAAFTLTTAGSAAITLGTLTLNGNTTKTLTINDSDTGAVTISNISETALTTGGNTFNNTGAGALTISSINFSTSTTKSETLTLANSSTGSITLSAGTVTANTFTLSNTSSGSETITALTDANTGAKTATSIGLTDTGQGALTVSALTLGHTTKNLTITVTGGAGAAGATNSGGAVTLAITDAADSGASIIVTGASGASGHDDGNVALSFSLTSGATATNTIYLGNGTDSISITDSRAADQWQISTGSGANTITLSTAHTGVNTLVFSANAGSGVTETLTNFGGTGVIADTVTFATATTGANTTTTAEGFVANVAAGIAGIGTTGYSTFQVGSSLYIYENTGTASTSELIAVPTTTFTFTATSTVLTVTHI